jgi:hypothetical protein
VPIVVGTRKMHMLLSALLFPLVFNRFSKGAAALGRRVGEGVQPVVDVARSLRRVPAAMAWLSGRRAGTSTS